MNCPSLLELTSADLDTRADLAEHIAACARCRALLASWNAEPRADDEYPRIDLADARSTWTPRSNPEAPVEVGAVHAVAAPGEDLYLLGLVIDFDDDQATLFPLSTENHWAGDWDVLVDEALLGYPVIIEAWNALEVARNQLRDQLALAAEPLRRSLLELYDRSLAGEPASDELAQGPALEHPDDPRHDFRERERERVTAYMRMRLEEDDVSDGLAKQEDELAPSSFGQLLREYRHRSQHELVQLAEEVDLKPAQLERLEGDTEDLRAHVPVATIGDLVSVLGIEHSEVLYALVEDAVVATDRTPPVDRQAALARRRRGVRARPPQAPEPERRARARAYADRLRQHLEGG